MVPSFFLSGSLPATKLIIDIAGPMCVGDCDNQNRTALHLATIGGHGDVVNYLLEHGGGCFSSFFFPAKVNCLRHASLIFLFLSSQFLKFYLGLVICFYLTVIPEHGKINTLLLCALAFGLLLTHTHNHSRIQHNIHSVTMSNNANRSSVDKRTYMC